MNVSPPLLLCCVSAAAAVAAGHLIAFGIWNSLGGVLNCLTLGPLKVAALASAAAVGRITTAVDAATSVTVASSMTTDEGCQCINADAVSLFLPAKYHGAEAATVNRKRNICTCAYT